MNDVYKLQYKPFVTKWGFRIDCLAILFVLIPPLGLLLMGAVPDWKIVLAACSIQLPLVLGSALSEPITYFPTLGSAGVYVGFLSGNVSNMKVPSALVSQQAAKVEQGTDEGEVVATIGITVSTAVNLVILTIGALFGAVIVKMLPDSVTTAMNLLLPALFGAMLATSVVSKPKLACYVVPVAFVIKLAQKMGWLGFIPAALLAALVPLTIVFGSMGLAVILTKKNILN